MTMTKDAAPTEALHVQPEDILHVRASGESVPIGEGNPQFRDEALKQQEISLKLAQADAAKSVGGVLKGMH